MYPKKDLVEFLGESMGKLIRANWEIFVAKKEAKIFRYCEEWKKFGPLLCRQNA